MRGRGTRIRRGVVGPWLILAPATPPAAAAAAAFGLAALFGVFSARAIRRDGIVGILGIGAIVFFIVSLGWL